MKYWLVKTEPETYSWSDLLSKGRDHWDGVRNFAARNNLKLINEGDVVFIYHSGKQKAIVAMAKCIKPHYPDPTVDDDRWVAVDLVPYKELNRPVSLMTIRNEEVLKNMVLVNNSRLSVQPVTKEEYVKVLQLSNTD